MLNLIFTLWNCSSLKCSHTMLQLAILHHGYLAFLRGHQHELSMSQHCITEAQQKQLLDASASGDKAELLRLISEGCDPVEIYNEYCQTPLHIASQHGKCDIVRLLVEAYGCDVEGRDNRGCMPVHAACLGGHLNTAVYLVHNRYGGGYCRPAYLIDASGNTVLHKACMSGNLALTRYIGEWILAGKTCTHDKLNLYHDDVVQYRICSSTQLHQPKSMLLPLNSHGDSPLHFACRCGHLNIVKYFMDEIPCVRVTASLLQVACQSGQTEVLQYLLETKGSNPMELDSCVRVADCGFINYESIKLNPDLSCHNVSLGNSLVHTACLCGKIGLVTTLLTQYKHCLAMQNASGDTPLDCACIADNVSLVNLLVTEYNCGCESPNLKGNTPLHTACEWGSLRVATTLINDFLCNPNICSDNGETPLHLACKYGRLEICNLLFADDFNACDVTLQVSKTKETPLHMACCGTSPKLVKSLLERCSSNQDIPDMFGDTPLFNACRSGEVEIVKLLTGKYCNPLYVNEQTQETPAHIACRMQRLDILCILLRENEEKLNQTNVLGETPLHIACKKDSIEIVNFLLQNNLTDLTIQDKSGATALHIACSRKQTEIAHCLISSMSTYDQVDNKGNTTLTNSCSRGSLDIVKLLTTASSINFQDKDGNTALHTACSSCSIDAVKLLTELDGCKFDLKNHHGDTPLHRACFVTCLDIVEILKSCCEIEVFVQNTHGNTPIHIACQRHYCDFSFHVGCQKNHYDINIVRCLLEGHVGKLDHLKNNDGFTPLHIACSNGALDIVQLLVQNQFCDPNEADQEGNTALHTACNAGNTEIAVYLTTTKECKLMQRNTRGHPPLFHAVAYGENSLVECLVKVKDFDLANTDQTFYDQDRDRYIPLLHFALLRQKTDVVMLLLTGNYCDPNQQDSKGNALLHAIGEHYWCNQVRDLVSYLLNREDCDLNCTNHEDATPLHVACRVSAYGNDFVEALFNTGRKIKVSARDVNGKTPIQITHNYEIIRLLIGHGADPQDVYEHYGEELERSKKVRPLHPFMKLFVLGNSEAGKSTLVESLKTETADSTSIVSVEGPTAGVLQSEYKSKEFGKVLIHDFAGHPEFHSSHSAFLESSLSPSTFSSPPIFIMVVNLNDREQKLTKSVQYWIKYIENHCSSTCEVKPHAIVIGSHADLLSQTALPKSLSSLKKTLEIGNSSVLKYFGPLCLDCRNAGSEQLRSLRMLLKESCSSLRQHVELDCRCHVLFTYLHEHFKDVPAITVGELQGNIVSSHPKDSSTTQHSIPLTGKLGVPLPYVVEELMKLLNALHDKGHLLILKGASEIKKHWIVLDQDSLHRVIGAIFAPQDFEQHLKVETNTGVLPSSKLDDLCPDLNLNPDIMKQFLIYSELGQKIDDHETLQLIMGKEDISAEVSQTQSFCFIPGLVNSERPVGVWNHQSSQEYSYCCGWCIECKPQHFLSPRFLQVLLLRLVFNYAASVSQDSDTAELPTLNRQCNIWKNGTHWCTRDGVEVLVEVIEQNTVVLLLMRCIKGQEMECVKLRSAIIGKILATKEKFFPRDEVQEYFLIASDIANYPNININAVAKIEMKEVANTVQKPNSCILYHSGMVSLEKLLYFEPYSTLGNDLLNSFFHPDNCNKELTANYLGDISRKCYPALQHFVSMLHIPSIEVSMYHKDWSGNPTVVLHHVLDQAWRSRQELQGGGTYQKLREEFDKYSIFCGRNPLTLCTRDIRGSL